MEDNNYKELIDCYGFLFEPELISEIKQLGTYRSIAADTVIMDYGEKIDSMPLLLSGAIKILRQDSNGDELALYYLERGDTCSMTVTCCLDEKKFDY